MTMTATTRIAQVGNVAIPVSDQEKALEFYRDKLGFETRRDAQFGPGMRWIEVAPPGSTSSIALEQARDDRPAGVDTGIRLVTNDAKADHADLVERGVDVDDMLDFGPGVPPMFSFRDRDGNRLVIVGGA
jgi:catechol 2,3-dioxygenase-like lactoylglutathione lyase family enzyme